MTNNIDGIKKSNDKSASVKINRYNNTDQTQNKLFDDNDKIEKQNSNAHHAKPTIKKSKSEVNFLKEYQEESKISVSGSGRSVFKLAFLIFLLVIFLVGSLIFSNYLLARPGENNLGATLNKLNLWGQLSNLIGIDDGVEKNGDIINILIMGMGGIGHDGPFLTDTMMLVNFKKQTSQLALISIPRDLVMKYSDSYYPKINELYTIGWQNQVDSPGAFAANVIGQNLDQHIDYFVVVDFNGFYEIINIMGGVKITVEKSFIDTQFPTADYEVQTVAFAAGEQIMAADKALKYVRSRHGDNGEGSDFARSRRQQNLLFAIKDQVLSYQTLLNPYKLSRLYKSVTKHVQTNISLKTALELYDEIKTVDFDNILQYTLDDSPGNLLVSEITEDGVYILKPKNGYAELQQFMNNIFNYADTANEIAQIEIQNGTTVSGLAYGLKQELVGYNLNVVNYKNAATQDYQRTIIYDFTKEQKLKTIALLGQIIPHAIITSNIPSHLMPTEGETISIDFIIILGQDRDYNNQLNEINE